VNATFTISLSVAAGSDVTVHYATVADSASASDFTAASGDVTIPAGQTSVTVSIAVTGDRVIEDTEYFFVTLSSPTNAFIGDGQGTGAIVDNEPRISISDVSKNEGNGNGKNANTAFVFTVTLSNAYDQAIIINFATADGTAKVSNSDYIATAGSITFAPGETSKTITVQVRGDKTKEPDEYFVLDLSDASTNAFLLDNQATGWINDDDTHGKGKP
jgi:urease beta subunit